MRHAYLIIAHSQIAQLKLLVKLLDHPDNDIYIMFDQKAFLSEEDQQAIEKSASLSNCLFLPRIDIYWGGYELVEAELQLLSFAVPHHYDYYHLLSEADLPLRDQETIHAFFAENQGKEFLTFSGAANQQQLQERVRYVYHYPHLNTKNYPHHIGVKVFRKCDRLIQAHRNRWREQNGDLPIGYGSQWFSITHQLATYILEQKQWIWDSFSKGWLTDELFIHTLVLNSELMKNVYDARPIHDKPDEFQGNLRYINWWSGTPHIWDIHDEQDIAQLNQGIELGHLFARKFKLSIDDIKDIEQKITEKGRLTSEK